MPYKEGMDSFLQLTSKLGRNDRGLARVPLLHYQKRLRFEIFLYVKLILHDTNFFSGGNLVQGLRECGEWLKTDLLRSPLSSISLSERILSHWSF